MSNDYARRGVSSAKEDVHFAIRNLDKGLYPNAFCKVIPDLAGGDPEWCNIMHADGAGTKSSLAYLYWKETGDISIWRGIAQDAIVMNLDDMLCAGATSRFLFSNTIGRNKFVIPGEVLSEIIAGMEECFAMLREYGIEVENTGGETADIGDLVKTLVHDSTAFCRLPRQEVITNEHIRPGDVIVGLASFGKAVYEKEYNSGIGSNGLTNARHDVLKKDYAGLFPESYDPAVPVDLVYKGKYSLTDTVEDAPVSVGKLLLSPTRTYLPVMREVFEKHRPAIHGMIHNTGGGQTKCMKFVSGIHIIKDNLFPLPPVFRIIQESSGASLADMYRVLNMGHRLEIYTDKKTAAAIIEIAAAYGIEGRIVGRCEASETNRLTIDGMEF
ncbi:MAG: AIR synthase-related protein [Bacteroidia bacterium]